MPPKTTRAKRKRLPPGLEGVVVAEMNIEPSRDAPKPGGPPPSEQKTRGIYLDAESRAKLAELEQQTGLNGSAVIRKLIKGADGARMARLAVLAEEMQSLLK